MNSAKIIANSGKSFRFAPFLIGAVVIAALYATSRYDYLLFHSVVELFNIVIAWGVFIVAWNARRLLRNNFLLVLGVAYLFVGGANILHLLSYKGMSIFRGYDSNLPTQLWILERYIESFSLLIAPFFIGRNVRTGFLLSTYGAVTALLVFAIFQGSFPVCYIEGYGLTTFKKASEFVICAFGLGSIYTLSLKRRAFDPGVFRLLVASILTTVAAELFFTFYVSVYGLSNLAGHMLRMVATFLLYKAFIETGINTPFNLLFLELKRSERNLYSLLEELPAIVYLQGADYRIHYANRCFREQFEDPAGKTCHGVLYGEEKPCEVCETFKIFDRKAPQTREWVSPKGPVYQLYEYPFYDADDSLRVLKLGIDITLRKLNEEALREAKDRLEQRVLERTAELSFTNEKLVAEIRERERIQQALSESERELRALSARLLDAQEEERRHLAMELHDSIGGSLSAIKFGVEHAISRFERETTEKLAQMLQAVVPTIQNTVEEVRRIHTGIWPSILEDLGLIMAVKWLCRQFESTHGTIAARTEFEIDEADVRAPLKIVIYRVIQEALNNVGKHSGADTVHVYVGHRADGVELRIEDNGTGFSIESLPARSKDRGMGLASMRERTRLSGGTYELRSEPGKGTLIRAYWPASKTGNENSKGGRVRMDHRPG